MKDPQDLWERAFALLMELKDFEEDDALMQDEKQQLHRSRLRLLDAAKRISKRIKHRLQ